MANYPTTSGLLTGEQATDAGWGPLALLLAIGCVVLARARGAGA